MDRANSTHRRKASPEPEQPSNSVNNATYGDASQFVLIQRRKSPRLNSPRPSNPSPSLSPTLEKSHPLLPPAQNKEHTFHQLPPHPPLPPPPNPSQSRNNKKTDKASMNQTHRRSARLNTSVVEPHPNPSELIEPEVLAPKLPTLTEASSSYARIWFGPGPPPPLRAQSKTSNMTPTVQSGPSPQPHIASDDQTQVDTAAAQTRSSTRPHTARSPWDSYESPQLLQDWASWGPADKSRPKQKHNNPQEPPGTIPLMSPDNSAEQTGLPDSPDPSAEQTRSPDSSAEQFMSPDPSAEQTGSPDSLDPSAEQTGSPNSSAEQFMAPDPSAEQTGSPLSSAEQFMEGEAASTPVEYSDDGSIRCRLRRCLRSVPEAYQAYGRELDVSATQASAGKKKRKRNKGKSNVVCCRGFGKPRDPVQPADRPKLKVVGDAEFTFMPACTKVITTIRVLTLEKLPGPYRSYNMFPSQTRLVILQQFLQRYSWGPEERIGRCLDVFEKIAAEAYQRELNETRTRLRNKIGEDKESWKEFPPTWCNNIEYWKGLCDVWSTHTWSKQSATNRDNRTKNCKDILFHVTGSRSMFQHKQALKKEKGDSVGLKNVFDRTHMHKVMGSMEYVNQRAKDAAEKFVSLKGGAGI